jgi:hypothetical protein
MQVYENFIAVDLRRICQFCECVFYMTEQYRRRKKNLFSFRIQHDNSWTTAAGQSQDSRVIRCLLMSCLMLHYRGRCRTEAKRYIRLCRIRCPVLSTTDLYRKQMNIIIIRNLRMAWNGFNIYINYKMFYQLQTTSRCIRDYESTSLQALVQFYEW